MKREEDQKSYQQEIECKKTAKAEGNPEDDSCAQAQGDQTKSKLTRLFHQKFLLEDKIIRKPNCWLF